MEKKNNDIPVLQQAMTNSFQRMADLSMDTIKPFMDGMFENITTMNKSLSDSGFGTLQIPGLNTKSCNCCPPEQECPPHCIATITRQAVKGERIIVPFSVKNNCASQKTYKIGVRELIDEDGNMAPSQPQLNKNSITLDPGRSELVEMRIDLANYQNGGVFTTEIVLREKDINQNICFTLHVNRPAHITQVSPRDEKKYKLKWQDWKSHFYCEPVKRERTIGMVSNKERKTN